MILPPTEGRGHILEPIPFDPSVLDLRINRWQVDTDAADILGRSTFKGESQVRADLINTAVMDLTERDGGSTAGSVRRRSLRCINPVERRLLAKLGYPDLPLRVAAGCFYTSEIPMAARILDGTGVGTAAVSTAFPHGKNVGIEARCAQIREAVAAGANEIDVVIDRGLVLRGQWYKFYDEVVAMGEACGDAHMKVILGVGDIRDYTLIAKATLVALMAGAYCVKTSTGMEKTFNATPPIALLMIRMVRRFFLEIAPGKMAMIKFAGGIRTAKQARQYLKLMFEELVPLDKRWIYPEFYRLGASSLLTDIITQLLMNADAGKDRYADPTRIALP